MRDGRVLREAIVDAQHRRLAVAFDEHGMPLIVVDLHVHVDCLTVAAQIEQQPEFALDQSQVEEIELAAIVDVRQGAIFRGSSHVEPKVTGQTRPPGLEGDVRIRAAGENERLWRRRRGERRVDQTQINRQK